MNKGIPSVPSTDPEIHTDILNVTSKDWGDDMWLNYHKRSSSALSPRFASVDDSENQMMWKSYSIDDSALNRTSVPVSTTMHIII